MKKTSLNKFLLIAAQASIATTLSAQTSEKPNFVFFLVDDLGWADVACNGSSFYETPNIDRLASEGVRFTQAYAGSPVSSPTRASIMSGKNPGRIRITQYIGGSAGKAEYERNLPLEEVTFPEVMQKAGYKNIFLGKWHLNNRDGEVTHWPDKQGFDINVAGHWRGGLYIKNKYYSPWDIPNLENGPDGEYMTDRLAKEACNFIDNNYQNPFLLYFSFYQVHMPACGKKELVEKYIAKNKRLGIVDADCIAKEEWHGKEFTQRVRQNDPEYAAMVEAMDQAVGKVLDKVKEKGLSDNTVVVFFSDNGGLSTSEGIPTSNAPLRYGKGWLYEGGIREPLIIKWPGVTEAGRVSDALVTSMDLYPTILDIAGLPLNPKQHVDGVSIVPILKNKKKEVKKDLYFHYPHYSNQNGTPASAVREGDYKLIYFFDDGRMELYNIKEDMSETTDLAARYPKITKKLYSKLSQWWKEADVSLPSDAVIR